MARLVLDPACITLAHSVLFPINPPERLLGDGGVTDFVVKPGEDCLLCLASHSLLLYMRNVASSQNHVCATLCLS